MGLISRFIEDAKTYLKTRPVRITDRLLGVFHALSRFTDRLDAPLSQDAEAISSTDIPSSVEYNKIINSIMEDCNAIREHQKALLSGMLISWNSGEQVAGSGLEESQSVGFPLDENFPTSASMAKGPGDITLATLAFNSGIPILKAPPALETTCTDITVTPFYGKAWGMFVVGNETGEDGIRINRNDGGAIVDGLDTFWEAEAVTLQEPMEDGYFTPQVINTNEVSISTNITLSFSNPLEINAFTILPHSFSQSVYYDVTAVNVISKGKTIPVLKEPKTCFSLTRVTFDSVLANGMTITLRQNKGYFIKYTMGKYKLMNNLSWVDVSGPTLVARAGKSVGDINQAIRSEIENAGKWIPSIWMPDTPSQIEAKLQVGDGEEGYLHVESVASRRKRWAIGIQDIDFGREVYDTVSEAVSTPYDVPEETTSVYLVVDDDTPPGTKVSYSLSFDGGSSWREINPLNKPIQYLNTGYQVPQRIFLNSDLSLERKQNSPTGEEAYVNTADRSVRVRGILERDETTVNTPRIRLAVPYFDSGAPS